MSIERKSTVHRNELHAHPASCPNNERARPREPIEAVEGSGVHRTEVGSARLYERMSSASAGGGTY